MSLFPTFMCLPAIIREELENTYWGAASSLATALGRSKQSADTFRFRAEGSASNMERGLKDTEPWQTAAERRDGKETEDTGLGSRLDGHDEEQAGTWEQVSW